MTVYTTTLQAREVIASNTMAFHFRRPEGFDFKPGQAIDLVLAPKNGTANEAGERHTFSIVTAPFQDELVIATRMRDSSFKHARDSMQIGAQATIDAACHVRGYDDDAPRIAQ